MIWRLAFPPVFLLGPRIITRLVRTAHLVWQLTSDRRVPLLLKLLVPGTVAYFLTPISRFPYIGPIGYLAILFLAVRILVNLAPRDVVESYAPWMARRTTPDGSKGPGSPRVVEGTYHLLDEEEPKE